MHSSIILLAAAFFAVAHAAPITDTKPSPDCVKLEGVSECESGQFSQEPAGWPFPCHWYEGVLVCDDGNPELLL
ncbi:MAG: hypothetical protein J3R72DRAFT_496106 [Linnemannia gamsii]|nr:MAG: hypothetical protein J3R72DRAFT_496106 [Linnemannia gamsii]